MYHSGGTVGTVTANNFNLFGHSGETNIQAFAGFTPGAIQTGIEQCDNGNALSGDGCSTTCQFESHIEARASAHGVAAALTGAVKITVPPTPAVSCLSGSACDQSKQLASLSIASLLQTKVLATHAKTQVINQNAEATATASVADPAISVLGLVSLNAGVIQSTAEIGGTCRQSLTATGTATLANGRSSGLLSLVLPAAPAPNTVLLDLLGIRIVLNEQILQGNGVTNLKLTVNAVSISIKNALLGLLRVVNGTVTVSQSKAEVDCVVPGGAP